MLAAIDNTTSTRPIPPVSRRCIATTGCRTACRRPRRGTSAARNRWSSNWSRSARSRARCSTRAPARATTRSTTPRKGYSATGIDGSAGALERARENAQKAGVSVNFELADATKLEGLDGPVRHRRRLRLLPHLQHRTRAAEVLRAGAAPGHQAGRAAVHVRVRRTRRQRLQHAAVVVRERLSRCASGRRLGDHLPGPDHLPGQHQRRDRSR